jgi:hypothetical protein
LLKIILNEIWLILWHTEQILNLRRVHHKFNYIFFYLMICNPRLGRYMIPYQIWPFDAYCVSADLGKVICQWCDRVTGIQTRPCVTVTSLHTYHIYGNILVCYGREWIVCTTPTGNVCTSQRNCMQIHANYNTKKKKIKLLTFFIDKLLTKKFLLSTFMIYKYYF